MNVAETICAWCSKELGRVDPPGTSHGICGRHQAAMMASTPILRRKERQRQSIARGWLRQGQTISGPAHGAQGEPATGGSSVFPSA